MGSDHWGTAIPELYSIADAREARFLGEYVLNTAFDLNERSGHIHLGIQTRNKARPCSYF